MKPEYLAIAVNLLCTSYYVWQRAELGKILYWAGATIITIGLLRMKG
jgi:hypothetical protein